MNLRPHIESIHQQLAATAEAGGDDARAAMERLMAPLESTIRLTLLDVLTAAAEDITCDLAPGSVEVRLRGRDPEFVVTPPPVDPSVDDETHGANEPLGHRPVTGVAPPADGEGDEAAMSRINLRLPEHLKARVERAAPTRGSRSTPGSCGRQPWHWSARILNGGPPAGRSALHGLGALVMPTFDTPEPISVSLELGVGDIRIVAGDRTDTVVEVRPTDPPRRAM